MFAVIIIILIVLILLFVFGFINTSRVDELKDDEICLKWDENNSGCISYKKTTSKIKDFFIWEKRQDTNSTSVSDNTGYGVK